MLWLKEGLVMSRGAISELACIMQQSDAVMNLNRTN